MHMYMYEGKTIQAHFYVEPSLKLINSTNKNPCRIKKLSKPACYTINIILDLHSEKSVFNAKLLNRQIISFIFFCSMFL